MKIPEAFYQLTGMFDPDLEEDIPEGQDVISYGVSLITEQDRKDVKKFLDEILGGGLSDRELAEIWLSAWSRRGFHDEGDYRRALEKIRQRLIVVLG